jgi:Fic family protein
LKLPQRPPNWSAHFNSLTQDPVKLRWLLQQTDPTIKGRYVHWEKLRHLPRSEQVTSLDWWTSLKLTRARGLRAIPLLSTTGEPFRLAVPDAALKILHTLDRDAGSQILVSEQVINSDSRRQYVISSLMEEAITSSQIEGAATTRQIAKEMLRTGRPARTRDERMILNNYQAMRRISEIAKDPLTPDAVFGLHRILGEDALDVPDAIGRFRRDDESIAVYDYENQVLHQPPAARELEGRMAAMCDFANEKTPDYFLHPVIRAIVLHFWLAYDHPFADGNGRCARALFYWSMLRSKYWLAEYLSISSVIRKAQVRYGQAYLYVETDEFDLTYFVLYHLELIRRAIDDLQGHLKRKMEEVRKTEGLLKADAHLNHRQSALLSHALRHPDAHYTFESHQTSHDVVYQTARSDLLDLERRGFLNRSQRGRAFIFRVPSDLLARLSGRQI